MYSLVFCRYTHSVKQTLLDMFGTRGYSPVEKLVYPLGLKE